MSLLIIKYIHLEIILFLAYFMLLISVSNMKFSENTHITTFQVIDEISTRLKLLQIF